MSLVGGLEHCFFPFSWEFHNTNWRTHIFQRGGSTTNQVISLEDAVGVILVAMSQYKPHKLGHDRKNSRLGKSNKPLRKRWLDRY